MNKNTLIAEMRKSGMSGVVVKRIEKLMERFATIDAFFSASRGAISKEYSAMRPGKAHGLGTSFWESFDKANAIYKKTELAKTQGAAEERDERDEHGLDLRNIRMMTLEELKTVTAFMELCDVAAINIVEILGFLSSVKMRQKKTPDGADVQAMREQQTEPEGENQKE